MDEIRRLENQIRELQRELERQNAEAASMRQRLANENLRRLQNYEQQMRTNLTQHDKEAQKEYERLLREYERSANAEIQEQQLQTDLAYMKLMKSVEQKEREWKEKTEQLEQLTEQLKRSTQNKDALSGQEAERCITEAALEYNKVVKKPHEKFFPKRIEAFFNTINEAKDLSRKGLNEAAIATSISAKSGLIRLGYDIDEKYNEWQTQYQLFKRKDKLVHVKISDEFAVWRSFADGIETSFAKMTPQEKNDTLKCLNYWTSGQFFEVFNTIAAYGRIIGTAEKQGLPNYIKTKDSISLDDLKKNITGLDKLNTDLETALELYKERFMASCQRSDWGEKIIDFLTDEINLNWIEEESHFRYVTDDNRDKKDYTEYMEMRFGAGYEAVDLREWLELVFTNSSDTKIFVYIVPYEKGTHVENRLVVHFDFAGAADEVYSREIYTHICESIHVDEDDVVVNYTTDLEELRTNPNATLRAAGRSIEKKLRDMQ